VNKAESNSIKLITFDLGNVLVKVDHMEFCRRFAVLTPLSTEDIFNFVFNGSLEPDYDTGKMTSQEVYQQVIKQFKVAIEFDRFARWWNSIFSPMPEMEEIVTKLAKKYPLFLLSNTNALHFDYILNTFPILRHFSKFVLSYEVGSRKPDKGIYEYLIRQSGILPGEILFLDDKLPFVTAAREHGIHAWQFTSYDAFKRQLMEYDLW
jgi:glucose-1-phosphatase